MKSYFKFWIISISIILSTTLSAQIQNVKVSSKSTSTYEPNEVTIAVNPLNGAYLAAGANIKYLYTSNDSGKTWTETLATADIGLRGDPAVIYDALGNLYYAHLSNTVGGAPFDAIGVNKSSNNGLSWNAGTTTQKNDPKFQDKEWLIADWSNSIYRNNIYMSWTEFDKYGSNDAADSSRILFSYSTNSGNDWSTPVRVSDRGGNCIDDDETVEGAVPAVGPNGEVYVSWAGWGEILFDKSLDGGKTFGKDKFVANQPNGWAYDISGITRCNGMPITLCDISNSQYRGSVYVVWGDTRNGNGDIFIIKSTDGGAHWGPTTRVDNDFSGKDQFFPWATIDQTTGYIYVVFYDRRNYTDDHTDVYLAVSKDGGLNFQNFKISETSFLPIKTGPFFGDYTGITAHDGNIYPIWMRMDDNKMSVWTALVKDKMLVGIEDDGNGKIPEGYELAQNYPNPFNPSTSISYKIPKACKVTVKIYDLSGKELETVYDGYKEAGTHKIDYDASNLSSGRYFYVLNADNLTITKKMILQK